VDNSGNVHIAFREWMNYLSSGFDRDLYYVQWNNNTETWIPIELVSSESDDHSYGPSLAIDASGDLNIVWYDFADYDNSGNDLDIFYKQRNNISGIWTSTDVVSTQSGAYSKNPKIIIDNSDKMHIAWSDRSNYTGSGTEYDIFYKQWNKTLGDWTTTEVISTVSNGTSDSNNPSMIVDNFENICIVWSDSIDYNDSGNDDDILYRNWNSTIGNWTETRVVSTESDSNSIFPQLAIDNFGSMHIAWQDSSNISSSDFDYDIVYKKLIVHNRPSVNDPTDIITTNTGSETIDWIITDDVGEGMYRVIIDNTIVEIDWTPWNNNTIINIPIDRTAPGSFLYTIEYYDLYDIYGINNTITITIEDAFPTINHPNNPNIEKDYLHTIEWTIVDDFGGGNYRIFVNDIPGNWQPWTSNIPIEYTVDSTIIGDFNVTIQYQTTTGQIDYDTVMVDIIPSGAEVFMDLLPYILIIVGVILGISSYLIIKNHNKSKKVAVWKEKAHVFSDLLNIDLILIIHKETSSTIVQHNFSEQTLDGDLISGFLEAMTSFKYELKKNSYKKRSMETTLLDYDQYKVLIKDGLFIRVAMILDKEPSNYLQDSIVEFINEFEARYSDILKNFIGRITQFQTSIDLINKYFNVSLIYPHCINRKHLSIEMTSFQKEIMKLAQQLESTKGQFYISELINYIASEKSDELKEKIIANIIDLRQSGLIKLSNF
ncbi:MAG: hypothetical protein KGD63_01935, partial [Candidatus Lokiarchaeota archaeon]|nr:hypothetical protein [Candidatus Lokiarchaeota archaeon]